MKEITLNVSNKELNNMEDLAVCYNVCKFHKRLLDSPEFVSNPNYEVFDKSIAVCKKCISINKRMSKMLLHTWCKMVTAYEKV